MDHTRRITFNEALTLPPPGETDDLGGTFYIPARSGGSLAGAFGMKR